MRKSLGQKRRELSPDNIRRIIKWYHDFEENEQVKIFDNQEFLYKEFLVMQPLQRRGAITEETLEAVTSVPFFAKLYDDYKYCELLETEPRTLKKDKELQKMLVGKDRQENILTALRASLADEIYPNFEAFSQKLKELLSDIKLTPSNLNVLALAMSQRDKTAEVITTKKKDKFGDIADGIVYDKTTKDSEIVKLSEDESKLGAEIPFTRYFYKYQAPEKAENLLKEFYDLEEQLQEFLEDLKHD